MMLNTLLLSSMAIQFMGSYEVDVEGKWLPLRHSSGRRLRLLAFAMGGCLFAAIKPE
jgi:hypothetical protein